MTKESLGTPLPFDHEEQKGALSIVGIHRDGIALVKSLYLRLSNYTSLDILSELEKAFQQDDAVNNEGRSLIML